MEVGFMGRQDSDERVPSLSGKEALILELLLGKPGAEMYGLELVHTSRNRLKRGTIYVTLSRMEDKAYVESRLEGKKADASGLPRRLYHATGYGKRVYEAWQLAREAGRRHFAEIGGAA
jgi:DNA-binding PadR family transcriptional regulator